MKANDYRYTLKQAYQAICEGEKPWVALGNFMNAWFDYASDQRAYLVADPLILPERADLNDRRWAAFCAASVEWLCNCYGVPCPSWVDDPVYILPEPWFDSPAAYKPQVRERLRQQTPEPFIRRNIFCGDRIFANKYDFIEQYRHVAIPKRASTSPRS